MAWLLCESVVDINWVNKYCAGTAINSSPSWIAARRSTGIIYYIFFCKIHLRKEKTNHIISGWGLCKSCVIITTFKICIASLYHTVYSNLITDRMMFSQPNISTISMIKASLQTWLKCTLEWRQLYCIWKFHGINC